MDNQRLTVLFRLSLVALLLLCCSPALAQTTSVSGTVTDEQDARLPGATITLTSSAGATRAEVTNEMGTYKFPQLSPGVYQLKAELQGFKTTVRTLVELLVDTPTVVDFKLQIGEITLKVIVEERVSKLNTQDATLGNAIDGQQIRQLPLESRNVAALLSIQPAVTPLGYASGSRSDQSNLTLDGIDVNEQQTGTAFETVLRITPDSVQEFRVTTALPTAIQGRSSGGQVSLITRSGSNQWHGSLYHFHRNTITTANDFFNNRSGVERPKLIRNLFGGALGGPIMKDRALFFYNYEGRRDAKGESVLRTVPLPGLGRGEVKYLTASGVKTLTSADLNRIYPVGTNPAASRVLAEAAAKYPANDSGVGDGLNYSGFRFNAPRPVKQNAHTATLSFNLTRDASHTLLLRGNYQQDLEGGIPQFPDTPGTNLWSHPTGWSAIHTWTASNRLVNTVRFGITREAFSSQGDSSDNWIAFRDVYSPRRFSRTLSRTTPTYNIVDDVSWVRSNHTWQFGANIRTIRNNRIAFDKSFDSGFINASTYDESGAVLNIAIPDIEGSRSSAQAALTAVIGRYSEYGGSFNFGVDGSILPQGEGIGRLFATEEYEFYAQDSWRIRPSLTLTLGLRYGINTPVYEANGLQVSPDVSLGEFFERRKESAARGIPVNDVISVDLAGPKRDRPGYYKLDKNNFAPRAAIAWSPAFDNAFLRRIFGGPRQSVFRGGFAMLHDRVGSALAVNFDLNNQLGFSSSEVISANTYNVSDRPAPLFTGFNQVIRSLPGIKIPATLLFPQQRPADGARRIESTLDDTITTPAHYSWNFSVAREFTGGLSLEASYIGRSARNLLANRDIMHLNNLVDNKSGMDWYTAAGLLYDLRYKQTPASAVQPIPYFENLFPNYRLGGQPTATQSVYSAVEGLADYTFVQHFLDDEGILPNAFFHPQYAALAVQSTVAYSDYHAGTLTLRERFKQSLSFDLNYTFSKSLDNSSALERDSLYSSIILNPLRPDDNKAISNFDLTHIINSAAIWELPVGRGRAYLNSANPLLNQFLAGWQLTGIFRWNSGLPISAPFDAGVWATNWNVTSNGTRIRALSAAPTKSGVHPNFFADPKFAYQSFRNAKPGETGERNTFRRPGFISLDFGLGKTFKLPQERHTLQLRWEVFNATNTQRLSGPTESSAGYGLQIDPHLGEPAPDFGRINSIQGNPRIMQFALRWDF
jgi:hypothetical protein